MFLPDGADVMLRNDVSIRSLRSSVSHDEALRHFSGGVRGLAAQFLRGRARAIADLSIPHRLFQVEIKNRGRLKSRLGSGCGRGRGGGCEGPQVAGNALLAGSLVGNSAA